MMDVQVTGDGGLGKCKLYDPDVVAERLHDTLETQKRVRFRCSRARCF